MKKAFRTLIPERLLSLYHYGVALAAAVRYGFPSRHIVTIGITGTKGKTSTTNFIWSCLSAGGIKTGIITTANIRIGDREILNAYHMTMPGPFTIQRLLREMVRAGCTHCVIETTSEGLKQHRDTGLQYDIAVFTNLFPEHLPSHGGSFEAYKEMKGKMFASLRSHPRKVVRHKQVEKIIIANAGSEHAPYFLAFPADCKVTFAVGTKADYAHEGESMRNVLETAAAMRAPGGKIIVLLGAEGGGRDKAKRPIMGKLTGTMADYIVVSNVDPYDDDPQEILEDIVRAAEKAGKKRGADLFVIEDRREGIKKALSLAGAGDIVLITGKGAEQSMALGGKSLPWDDRTVVREELHKPL